MRLSTWFWSLVGLAALTCAFFLLSTGEPTREEASELLPIGWSPDAPVPCPSSAHQPDLFEPGSGPCNVQGIVEAEDGTPLGGRIVLALPARQPPQDSADLRRVLTWFRRPALPGAPGRAARTDERGRFVLRGLAGDRGYDVQVDCGAGWTRPRHSLGRFALRRGAFVRLVVEPGSALSGQVLTSEGEPVQAYVTFSRDGNEQDDKVGWSTPWQTTDAAGRFRAPAAPEGELLAWVLVPNERMERIEIPANRGDEPLALRLGAGAAGSVEGRLRTHAGEPLAGVHVFLRTIGLHKAHAEGAMLLTKADAAGRWRMDGIPLGQVIWAGFIGKERQGTLDGLRLTEIEAGKTVTHDVMLPPDVTVTGTIRDGDLRALAAVPVEIRGGTFGRYVITRGRSDEAGRYRLEAAAHPELRLVCGAPGLGLPSRDPERTRRTFELRPGGGVSLEAGSAGRTLVHDLTLEPLRVLSGRAVDESGRGVAGALLYLEDSRDEDALGAEALCDVRADASGRFRVALPTHFKSVSIRAILRDRASGPWPIPKSAGPEDDGIELLLRPTSLLTGRVHDPRGRGLGDMDVRIKALDHEVTTAPDGRFTLAGVPPGEHEVLVRPAPRYRDRDSKTVSVTTPRNDSLDIVWRDVHRFVGQVLDRDERPVAGIEVKAWPVGTSETWAQDATTDEDGWFEIAWLASGRYLVKLDDQLLDPPRRPGPEIRRWRLPAGVRSVALHGTVLDPRGVPITDGEVVALRGSDAEGERLDRDWIIERDPGGFDLRIPGDVTELTLIVTNPVSADGQRDAAPRHVVPGVDPRAVGLTVALPLGRVLRGRVVSKHAVGVEGARIYVRSAEGGRRSGYELEDIEILSTTKGHFEIPGLGEGALVLDVLPGGPYKPVQGIRVAGLEREIEIPVEEGRAIRGVVVDPKGAPVAGARIEVFPRGTTYIDRDELLAEALTGADGRYELPALGSGPFTLRVGPAPANRKGWPHPVWQPMNQHAGSMRKLQLPQGQRLEIDFVGPDGEPVPERHAFIRAHRQAGPSIDLRPAEEGSHRHVSPLLVRGWYELVVFSGEGYQGLERRRLFVPCDRQRIELRRAWVVAGRVHHDRADDFQLIFNGSYRGREVRDYDSVGTDGTFSFALEAPATGTIHATLEGTDLYVWLPDVKAPRGDLLLKPKAGDSIRGRIALPDAADAHIEAIHPSGVSIDGDIAHDGTFQIRGLPPGPYTLEAWHGDWPDVVELKSIPCGARNVVVK